MKDYIEMTMPEGCWQYNLKYFEPRWKKSICTYMGRPVDLDRPDWCPIKGEEKEAEKGEEKEC